MKKKTGHSNFLLSEEMISSFDIQECNMKTFSKEIYENIGQVLSLVKMKLGTLQVQENKDPGSIIEDSSQLLGKAIRDLRRLTKQLTPTEILKKGFAVAIEEELSGMQDSGVCTVSYSINGKKFKLDTNRELMAFCLVQQLLKKALREKLVQELICRIRYYKVKMIVSLSYKTNAAGYTLIGESMEKEGIIKKANFINATVATGSRAGLKTTKICFFK